MLRSVNRLAVNGKNTLKQKNFVKSYATASDKVTFEIDKNAFVVHQPKNVQGFTGPNYSIEVSKEETIKMYRMMQLMRKFEIAADEQYKQREIRGFCHLYDGQEAVCTGIEFASTKDDHVITAYRDHAHQLARGDTPRRVMAELFGKSTGCSKGKGGSMHMYLRSANFFGGNGIVGAQVPVGAGLAFGLKYWAKVINKKPLENVAYAYFGDGASNQGQVFEAYNMAKLWNIPAIFVCEDNKYGMGTSVSRSSASTDYYSRGDYVPGIKVDGMDVFSVLEATRYAKQWAVKNGPVILHMSTYRYHGHSMSDPGISYRSRDEIKEVRQTRDPIENLKKKLFAKNIATQDQLDKIDEEIAAEVADCVEFAKKSDLPPKSDFVADILLDKEYTVKGTSAAEVYHVVNNVLQN